MLQKECEALTLNIIIHGLPEEADTSEGKEEDIKAICKFLDAIGVAPTPELVSRLGR